MPRFPPFVKVKMKSEKFDLYATSAKIALFIQGGFFNWSARFSVPKWKQKIAQPTRSFFTLKILWKTSPGWLQLVFHFGTEDRADQLKKIPCIYHLKPTQKHFPFQNATNQPRADLGLVMMSDNSSSLWIWLTAKSGQKPSRDGWCWSSGGALKTN